MSKEKPEITNKMKANCIGEFSWKEESSYFDEFGEIHDCEIVNTVPWDLCKDIYKKMYMESLLPDRITALEERVRELEASRQKIASSLVDKIFQDLEPETQKAILNYRLAEINNQGE